MLGKRAKGTAGPSLKGWAAGLKGRPFILP
ncbi:hypothetical protein X927_00760 [Petrotoga mexicana DSM 14811]|uniref:Uncharacterized protein n=1 Tax=Petrotoga mexicana DSM 14811 TaxID=1122954 RepID=A0A2K1PFC2_9BACT|nr:hypothetical protein X927_00760 [Petrotoga mexicana DSM 14811]